MIDEMEKRYSFQLAKREENQQAQEYEYQVFLESGYIEENPHKRILEYDRFSDHTVFYLIVDRMTGVIHGVNRMNFPDREILTPECFQTLSDFDIFPEVMDYLRGQESKRICEIATISIKRQHPNARLLIFLFQKIREVFILEMGYQVLLASMDAKLFWLFERFMPKDPYTIYGNGTYEVQAIGTQKFYIGSEAIPAMISPVK